MTLHANGLTDDTYDSVFGKDKKDVEIARLQAELEAAQRLAKFISLEDLNQDNQQLRQQLDAANLALAGARDSIVSAINEKYFANSLDTRKQKAEITDIIVDAFAQLLNTAKAEAPTVKTCKEAWVYKRGDGFCRYHNCELIREAAMDQACYLYFCPSDGLDRLKAQEQGEGS